MSDRANALTTPLRDYALLLAAHGERRDGAGNDGVARLAADLAAPQHRRRDRRRLHQGRPDDRRDAARASPRRPCWSIRCSCPTAISTACACRNSVAASAGASRRCASCRRSGSIRPSSTSSPPRAGAAAQRRLRHARAPRSSCWRTASRARSRARARRPSDGRPARGRGGSRPCARPSWRSRRRSRDRLAAIAGRRWWSACSPAKACTAAPTCRNFWARSAATDVVFAGNIGAFTEHRRHRRRRRARRVDRRRRMGKVARRSRRAVRRPPTVKQQAMHVEPAADLDIVRRINVFRGLAR